MLPRRPLYFVLDMNRLNTDVDKVAILMATTYVKNIAEDGKALASHSIEFEAILLKQFKTSLRKQIDLHAPESGTTDVFGNEYFGFERYDFIEISVSYDYQVYSSIRFLGSRRNKPIRFALYGIPVNVDPTTLNIVSDIRSLSESVQDFFGKISTLMSCRPGSFTEDASILENIAENGFDVTSNIGWYQFVNDYFAPKPVIVSKTSLTKDDLEAIIKKYDGKLFKSGEEIDNEFTDFLGLKSELARIANSNFEINNSGKQAFFTDLDKQIETLGALYSNVFDKFTLGCLIQEALECIRPPLACKDILRELSVDIIQERIVLAFPLMPEVVKRINKIIQDEKDKEALQLLAQKEAEDSGGKLASIQTPNGESAGILSLTDKVLDAIETVIDIEAICDLRIPFEIPKIELPNFPTIDLMFDINVQLDTAILEALAKALLELILGILRDLLDCRKLDNFIAGLMDGEIADDSGAYGDLAKLFTDPASLGEDSNVANAFGSRWDNFVDTTAPLLEDIVKFQSAQEIGLAEKTLTFTQITEGSAGLGGLKELVQSGNFGELEPKVDITKDETGAKLDITKLISFTGPGSEEANRFISEIGAWQLSDDGNSFTLSRLSDDRVTVISKIASKKTKPDLDKLKVKNFLGDKTVDDIDVVATPQIEQELDDEGQIIVVREERISGQELFNEIGRLFDTIISVLSPTETINLLAGKANSNTIKVVLEIARIKHPRLTLFVNTEQKISILFEMFGRSAGLDKLRDKLLLITASPEANKKLIPVKPCPPFDDVFDFRKELLRKTLPEDQVIKIIEILVNDNKKRFNDIQNGLAKIREGVPPLDVFEPLLCGGGKSPDGMRSPIMEDTLNSTINLMFEPTKMMFDREIMKYSDAISITKEKEVEVPRKISFDGSLPIFNPAATDGRIFGTINSLLGLNDDEQAQSKEEGRINPEFKQMVDSGFVPTRKTGDGVTDFVADGTAKEDYLDGQSPLSSVIKKETVKKLGSAFKEGMIMKDKDIAIDLNRKFKLTLHGSLDSQSPVSSFMPLKVSTPEWIIEYVEKSKAAFNIRAAGQVHSSVYGLIPFSENYNIENDDLAIEPELKNKILDISNSAVIPPRQDVFKKIFADKVVPKLTTTNANIEQDFNGMFEQKYESFVRATIKQISKGFTRNRLLKKVPNTSLTSLAPEGMSLGSSKGDDLIALNLVNFSPMPTDEQRACGIDPHLLDFEYIKKLVKERFDKECEEKTEGERIDGLSPRRGPINSAGFVGVVMSIVRLYSIEYILRALFVLDEFKFSKDLVKDDLLIDYITFRMQSDIKRLGFYEDFDREAKLTYKKLLQDGVVKAYSVNSKPIARVNSIELNQIVKEEISLEFKALVQSQMLSATKRIGEIIGLDTNKKPDLKSVFFEGLDIIDTFSDDMSEGYTSINSRFTKESIPASGKFVLERYVKIKRPTTLLVPEAIARTAIALEQSNPYLNEVINFKNAYELVSNIVGKNSTIRIKSKKIYDTNDKENSLFEQPWSIGLRLVYIPPAYGLKTKRESLSKNKFKISTGPGASINASINPLEVNNSKTLYVFDKQNSEPSFPPDDSEYFKQYNPISIIEKEIEIRDFITLGEANKKNIFEQIFDKKYFKILKDQLLKDTQLDVLIDYCLFSKKMLSLFMIHSTMVLNGEQIKFLFEGTKLELKKLFYSLQTLGDYTAKTEFKLKGGNSGEFQRKFNRIGDPSGPSGPDAFYYWSTTPIHILKALAVMTDPNLFWADKIVAAASSGYLTPKLVRIGSQVRLEGTNGPNVQMLNSSPGIPLDNEFKVLETGEVVRLINKLNRTGKPFTEHTIVALIGSIVDDVVSIKTETYPDGTIGPAIRSGAGFEGVPWNLATSSPAAGINLDNFNSLFDRKPSVPVYPGEKVNIPYGLASLALTPLQVFGTTLGPLCRTMYNPFLALGIEFLMLEPFIYNLPHFQIAAADTSMATDLKEVGIDLKGASNIKCEKDEEEE